MKKLTIAVVICSVVILIVPAMNGYAGNIPVSPEHVVIAAESAPVAVATLKDAANVTSSAVNILRLPRGIVKVAMSILPGPPISGGVEDIAVGILAPIDTTLHAAEIPVRLAGRIVKISNRLARSGIPVLGF